MQVVPPVHLPLPHEWSCAIGLDLHVLAVFLYSLRSLQLASYSVNQIPNEICNTSNGSSIAIWSFFISSKLM